MKSVHYRKLVLPQQVSAKHNGKQNYSVSPTNGLGEGSIKVLSDEELPGPEVGRRKSIQAEVVSCTVPSSL